MTCLRGRGGARTRRDKRPGMYNTVDRLSKCKHRSRHNAILKRLCPLRAYLLLAFAVAAGAAGPPGSQPTPKLFCYSGKVPEPTTPEIIEWSPEEKKYLLPLCQFGRLSNQVQHRHALIIRPQETAIAFSICSDSCRTRLWLLAMPTLGLCCAHGFDASVTCVPGLLRCALHSLHCAWRRFLTCRLLSAC